MGRLRNFLRRKTARLELRLSDLAGGSEVSGVIGTIAPGDGMFPASNAEYFEVGYSAIRCIRLALFLAGKRDVGTILDFGCGHGRVLRMLKAAFPHARLTACDLNRGGVEFCAETFGATPVDSAEDPGQIKLPDRYDLIWCGSVFTHLSADRWPGFLNLLFSHLARGGVAVLTTSGRTVANRLRAGDNFYGLDAAQIEATLREFDDRGFGFARQASGGVKEWGIAVSSPSWALAQFEKFPGLEILSYAERAWAGHQDVASLVRVEAD